MANATPTTKTSSATRTTYSTPRSVKDCSRPALSTHPAAGWSPGTALLPGDVLVTFTTIVDTRQVQADAPES